MIAGQLQPEAACDRGVSLYTEASLGLRLINANQPSRRSQQQGEKRQYNAGKRQGSSFFERGLEFGINFLCPGLQPLTRAVGNEGELGVSELEEAPRFG